MEKILVLFAFCVWGCGSNHSNSQRIEHIGGFIFDEFGTPIENAEVEVIEITYTPNLTDNNDGFTKIIQKWGKQYSDSRGYFKISVPASDGVREVLVRKSDFKPYRGVLNGVELDTMVLTSNRGILSNEEHQLNVEIN